MSHHAVDYALGRYAAQAEVVAAEAWFLAEYRAGSARHRQLHHIVLALAPSLETAVGVGGTPYAHYGGAHERGQMHVGRIHRHHYVDMAHQRQLGREAVAFSGERAYTPIALGPSVEHLRFLIASTEKENFRVGYRGECADHFFHQIRRVDFPFVFGERGYPYPAGSAGFGLAYGGVGLRGRRGAVAVEAVEAVRNRQTDAVEGLAVACACGLQRQQHLAVAARKGALAPAPFVDYRNLDAMQSAEKAQKLGAEHVVEVDEAVERELFAQLGEELPEPPCAVVVLLKIEAHYAQIFRRIEKNRRH